MAGFNNWDDAKKAKPQSLIDNTTRGKDTEWLTMEICKEYQKRAEPLRKPSGEVTGELRKLMFELSERCDISEVSALNILCGYYASYYVACEEYKRKLMLGELDEKAKKDDQRAFEEWRKQRAEDRQKENEYGWEQID